MNTALLVMLVMLLAALAWLWRARTSARAEEDAKALPAQRKKSAYHAVSIRCPKNACNAAKGMYGRRFLATAAPKLPLPACDAAQCNCQFVHHDDRRTGNERRSPFGSARGMDATGAFQNDQRAGKDRRKSGRNT